MKGAVIAMLRNISVTYSLSYLLSELLKLQTYEATS